MRVNHGYAVGTLCHTCAMGWRTACPSSKDNYCRALVDMPSRLPIDSCRHYRCSGHSMRPVKCVCGGRPELVKENGCHVAHCACGRSAYARSRKELLEYWRALSKVSVFNFSDGPVIRLYAADIKTTTKEIG